MKTGKKLFVLLCSTMLVLNAFGQHASKPTLMVIPSDAWCSAQGYMMEINNLGTTQLVPNYQYALQTDMNLKLAIATINDLMAERGFPLKDMEQTLKSIQQEQAEMELMTSKDGDAIAETPMDKIRRTAKADIILELTWNITKQGPKQTLTYILEGKDAYTGKSIGSANGVSSPSFSASVPELLQEAVVANIDNFNVRLQNHFDDMFANGREVSFDVRVFTGAGVDLQTEFDGDELSEIIEDWVYDNTVEHRFTKMDGSANYIKFEQVRIPLFNAKGRAIDTEGWARDLRKILVKAPYNVPCRVAHRGLGHVILYIGEN